MIKLYMKKHIGLGYTLRLRLGPFDYQLGDGYRPKAECLRMGEQAAHAFSLRGVQVEHAGLYRGES